jgi:hypothetical protein
MRRSSIFLLPIACGILIGGAHAQITAPDKVDAPDHGAVIDKTRPGAPPASAVERKPAASAKRQASAPSGAASAPSRPASRPSR